MCKPSLPDRSLPVLPRIARVGFRSEPVQIVYQIHDVFYVYDPVRNGIVYVRRDGMRWRRTEFIDVVEQINHVCDVSQLPVKGNVSGPVGEDRKLPSDELCSIHLRFGGGE